VVNDRVWFGVANRTLPELGDAWNGARDERGASENRVVDGRNFHDPSGYGFSAATGGQI
jgi:hypothetical protein